MLNLVGMGGTFDHLHEGHKFLIETALKISKNIVIGLTTEKMLKRKKFASKIEDFETRKKNLENFIKGITDPTRVKIVSLEDPYGPPLREPEYEGLVASQETYLSSIKLNELRVDNGLKPLIIIVIPMLLAENGQRFSSTTIRAKIE